jgi:prophage regulatory protein
MDIRNKLFRISGVSEITTLAKSTIWLKVSQGTFPKPIKLSPAISVWKETDIDTWIESHANKGKGDQNV